MIQAAVIAQGGDVLLLDMGEPIKINSLAQQMIRLSGLSLKNAKNPNGDIEIVCTGLRPGEKLYEELLIDAKSSPTVHPLIYMANEKSLNPEVLYTQLDKLESAIKNQDQLLGLSILSSLVQEWQPGKEFQKFLE